MAALGRDRVSRGYQRLGTALASLVYLFILVPSVLVIPISFNRDDQIQFPPTGFSLRLYEQFFGSAAWMVPLWHSVEVAVCTTVLALAISVPAAYAMVRKEFPGKQVLVLLLLSPAAIPAIVTALALYLYFAVIGLNGSLVGLVLAHTVYVTPFVVVTIGAGVRKLDERLEFAAIIMGANKRTLFAQVVLPQLRASILAGGLFALLLSFDEVVIAWLLTGANTMTLPVKMYSSIQWEISPVIAAVSTLLTLLSFLVCTVSALFQPVAASDTT